MRNISFICISAALSACTYEETELQHYDFSGTVKIPKEALQLTFMDELYRCLDDGGIGARLLWNLAGPSLKRIAITLGEELMIENVKQLAGGKDALGHLVVEIPWDGRSPGAPK